MFSVPAFTISTYKEETNSFTFGLELISAFGDDTKSEGFKAAYDSYLKEHKNIRTPVIIVSVPDDQYQYEDPNIKADELRSAEKELVPIKDGEYVAVFDLRANTRLTAGLGICRTIFVCFVLAAGAMFFSKDANDLVIMIFNNLRLFHQLKL
jgi:hypothetical protein